MDNGLSWAIELVRESSDLEEHEARFEQSGLYAPIERAAQEYVILDFRAQALVCEPNEHVWCIQYAEHFDRATIFRASCPPLEVPLCGGSLSSSG